MDKQNVYIAFADAYTCLGDGKTTIRNLRSGENGFTKASDVFSVSARGDNTPIGVFTDILENELRIPKILKKMTIMGVIPSWFSHCQTILAASSLGDLRGENQGKPIKDIFNFLFELGCSQKLNMLVSSACSSGTDSLGHAFSLVQSGQASIVGVLAVDCLDPVKFLQHRALGTLSSTGAKPFDRNRNGTTFSEGGSCMVLANDEGMHTLNVKPKVKVTGYSLTCDAQSITSPHPSGMYLSKAIKKASSNIGIPKIINLHGSGTLLSDKSEFNALKTAFPSSYNSIHVNSTKGGCGHLLGATGLAEGAITALMMESSESIKTVGCVDRDYELDLNIDNINKIVDTSMETALSITCGFGGVNSCVGFERVFNK